MSYRAACQRFSFVSLLIILSLLLPANNLPGSAQQPPAVPDQPIHSSPVMFIENVGQFAKGALPGAQLALDRSRSGGEAGGGAGSASPNVTSSPTGELTPLSHRATLPARSALLER